MPPVNGPVILLLVVGVSLAICKVIARRRPNEQWDARQEHPDWQELSDPRRIDAPIPDPRRWK